MYNSIFVAHLACTWFMTGLIWFVQVVHYPLYAHIAARDFVDYENAHCSLTTLVVAPVMLLELFSALALLFAHPKGIAAGEAIINLFLLGLIWLATFFIADQMHGTLNAGLDLSVVKALVQWNWLRTIVWSIRALGLSFYLLTMLSPDLR